MTRRAPTRSSRTARAAAAFASLAASFALALPGAPARADDRAPAPAAPTRTASAPVGTASFFSVQSVATGSAVIVIAGDAIRGALSVEWAEEAAGPSTGPEAPPAAAPSVVTATVTSPGRSAEARLAPLRPDARYRATVRGTAGAALSEITFRTPPLPGAREVVFAAFGDTGELPQEFVGAPSSKAGVARAVLASTPRPELAVHTGDIAYPDGSWQAYRLLFFGPMQTLARALPIFPSLGNHDVRDANGRAALDVFATPANNPEKSERYYSFDWGDVHFVALDVVTSPFTLESPQRRWLVDDLVRSQAAWKVVYFHYPPFSDASHGDNKAVIEELVPVLEAAKVDLCLTGHDHCYERLAPRNGVTYIVTGGGGAKTYEIEPTPRLVFGRSVHHFVRGRADARRMTLEAVGVDGAVFDAVTLEKAARPR